MIAKKLICITAIIRDEEHFINEWLAYHILLGVDHFLLYDDDPAYPLADLVAQYSDYVTVIMWDSQHQRLPGRNRQTKAYWHAVENYGSEYEWMAFIDVDEFIVLRQHSHVKDFLDQFKTSQSISLNWHIFGHNGHFENPDGLIIENLIRRKLVPSNNVKSITRTSAIDRITSAHFCRLKRGTKRVDANGLSYTDKLYDGKTSQAHINHYQCRSFLNWMARVERGDVAIEHHTNISTENLWRTSYEGTLKQFVKTVALDKNEHIDTYMHLYCQTVKSFMQSPKLQ